MQMLHSFGHLGLYTTLNLLMAEKLSNYCQFTHPADTEQDQHSVGARLWTPNKSKSNIPSFSGSVMVSNNS